MSENVKKFGSGAIISALVLFTMTGVFGWIGVTTAEVPALKAQSKSEFAHINTNIRALTDSSIKTNKEISRFTGQVMMLSETLVVYGLEIRELKKDCIENHTFIEECKEYRRINK